MFFILMERYSDFNSMIERYEKEMRRLFEEKQRVSGFEEPAVQTADFSATAQMTDFTEPENLAEEKTDIPVFNVPDEPEEKTAENVERKGKIIAEVTTGRGAVPLSGVTVVIDRLDAEDPIGRKELVAVKITDQSGRTAPAEVNALPKDLSLEPGNTDPFTTFYVSAEAKGFEPVKNRPVDVFSDEISILKIDLVPKPENFAEGGRIKW